MNDTLTSHEERSGEVRWQLTMVYRNWCDYRILWLEHLRSHYLTQRWHCVYSAIYLLNGKIKTFLWDIGCICGLWTFKTKIYEETLYKSFPAFIANIDWLIWQYISELLIQCLTLHSWLSTPGSPVHHQLRFICTVPAAGSKADCEVSKDPKISVSEDNIYIFFPHTPSRQ